MLDSALSIFEQVILILLGGFSTYIIFYFMSRFGRTIYRKRYIYIIVYIVYTVSIFAAQYVGGILFNLLITLLATIVVGYFLYNDKKIYVIYYSLYIVALICFQRVVIPLVNILCQLANINFSSSAILGIAGSLVIQFVNLGATRFFLICYKNKNIQRITLIQYFNFLVLPLFSIFYVVTLLMYIQLCISNYDFLLITVNIASIIILNVFITNIFESISKNNELKNELMLYEQQSKMQYEYYNNLEKKYKHSRKLIHDVKNHLQTLEELYNLQHGQEADEYTRDMYKLFDKFTQKTYTSNKVLNIILNDKIQKAAELDVEFNCKIGNAEINFIKDIDLTSIFANLIDNAIEGARKAGDEKYVMLKMDKFNGSFIINIENSIDKLPVMQGDKFLSTKKNHEAMGVGNVRRTVENYQGDMRTDFTDKIFKVNIVIPEG